MAKILRESDRVNLTVGEVVFTVAPLKFDVKQELASCTKLVAGKEILDLAKAQFLYIKYALKDIKGVEDHSGEPYELEFEGEYLTDSCTNEILTLEQKDSLSTAAWQIVNGVNGELIDPLTGEKLEGVSLEVQSGKLK